MIPDARIAQELAEARRDIDAAWHYIQNGYDIETRAEVEQQYAAMGFKSPLEMAMHLIWKRDPLVASLTQARDEAQQQLQAREEGIANLQTLLVHAYQNNASAYNQRDEARAELSRLRAALQAVTDDMDWAGGDGYGMPECPWCHAEGHGERKEHHGDCELVKAREALAPHHEEGR